MNPALLLPLSGLCPLLLALLLCWKPLRAHVHILSIAAPVPALLAAFLLPLDSTYALPKGHLEALWVLDPIARSFLRFSAPCWAAATLFATFHFHAHPRRASFFVPFLAAQGGNFLLIPAQDIFTFLSGLALVSFSAWGLVVFEGKREALFAGRAYIGFVALAEALLFPALALAASLAGSPRIAEIQNTALPPLLGVVFLLGFGIKAGLFPFPFWLPLAHPVAPTPGSAVLSACVIKAGVLGWLRFLPLYGEGQPQLAKMAAVLACMNLLACGLWGLPKRKAKVVLAYSSLQAVGMLLLLLVPVLAQPDRLPQALPLLFAYLHFHAFHKTGLFLSCAGPSHPLRWLWLLPLAGSYMGLPYLPGAAAKHGMKDYFAQGPLADAPWILPAAGAITALLCLRLLHLFRQAKQESGLPASPRSFPLPAQVLRQAWEGMSAMEKQLTGPLGGLFSALLLLLMLGLLSLA